MAEAADEVSGGMPAIARGRSLHFHPPEFGEVATIALTGWLYGIFLTVLFITGFTVSIGGADVTLLLMLPFVMLTGMFGVGLSSVIWVLPNAFVLAAMLRALDARALPAAATFLFVTAIYAANFDAVVDGLLADRLWFVPLIFGVGQAYAYHRTLNA